MEHEALTRTIIGAGMKVHGTLGPGFFESVYKNALAIELRARGLLVEREVRFKVYYQGIVVGEYSADMFVEGTVLVEAKAIRALTAKDEMQLVHYLTGTTLDVGLLLNFGGESLQVRRKHGIRRSRPGTGDELAHTSANDANPSAPVSPSLQTTATPGTDDCGICRIDRNCEGG